MGRKLEKEPNIPIAHILSCAILFLAALCFFCPHWVSNQEVSSITQAILTLPNHSWLLDSSFYIIYFLLVWMGKSLCCGSEIQKHNLTHQNSTSRLISVFSKCRTISTQHLFLLSSVNIRAETQTCMFLKIAVLSHAFVTDYLLSADISSTYWLLFQLLLRGILYFLIYISVCLAQAIAHFEEKSLRKVLSLIQILKLYHF